MKLKILFVALFVAGVAASIALGSPGKDGTGSTTASASTSTSTGQTTTGEHKRGDDNENGKKKGNNGCRQVELQGTVAASTLTVTVTKSSKRVGDLGTSVTLAVPAGAVRVSGRLCTTAGTTTTAGAPTLQLTQLKVANGKD